MINRKNSTKAGINAHVGIEPNAASSSNNRFTNNVYVQTPYPADVKLQTSTFNDSIADSNFVREREIELPDLPQPSTIDNKAISDKQDVRTLILETYANILLNQDVALIANLVSKHTIIVPHDELQQIIQCITGNHVDVIVSEDNSCCSKKGPIVKVYFIKVVTDSGQVITDFKQVFNKEYNELTGKYHLNLKYVVV